jgi:Uncharacterized conserved protein
MSYEQIPQELRNLAQWGLFKLKWVPERKKNTKIPFSAINGEMRSLTILIPGLLSIMR